MGYKILHFMEYGIGKLADSFYVRIPLSVLGVGCALQEVVSPHIDWKENCISFECAGEDFRISLNNFELLGVNALQNKNVEFFDSVFIDPEEVELVLAYTAVQRLTVI